MNEASVTRLYSLTLLSDRDRGRLRLAGMLKRGNYMYCDHQIDQERIEANDAARCATEDIGIQAVRNWERLMPLSVAFRSLPMIRIWRATSRKSGNCPPTRMGASSTTPLAQLDSSPGVMWTIPNPPAMSSNNEFSSLPAGFRKEASFLFAFALRG